MQDDLGVDVVAPDVAPLIQGQDAPPVITMGGNGVFTAIDEWIAFGRCPAFTRFDAVLPRPTAWRAAVLADVLGFFDVALPLPVGVTPDARLQVDRFPNPFNATVTIALDMPTPAEVSVRIHDLRGALVRTLADERLTGGRHEIVWNGEDARGAAVASGVDFCEVRTAGDVIVEKLVLVKSSASHDDGGSELILAPPSPTPAPPALPPLPTRVREPLPRRLLRAVLQRGRQVGRCAGRPGGLA